MPFNIKITVYNGTKGEELDLVGLEKIWQEFESIKKSGMKFNPDHDSLRSFKTYVIHLYENEVLVGFYSGFLSRHPFSKDLKVLNEIIWYIYPQYRGKAILTLLQAIHDLGKSLDVDIINLAVPTDLDERIGKLLTLKKYDKLETMYSRRLSNG